MDIIEDFAFGCFLVLATILMFTLIGLFIYATIDEINKDDDTKTYQKCICEKVD